MEIGKAYDYYIQSIASGDSKEIAIEDATHVFGVPKQWLIQFINHWESLN